VQGHISQAQEMILLWDQHVEALINSAKSEDYELLIDAGLNSFSFFYSAKYSKWNFERYLKYPAQYQIDMSTKKSLEDLSAILKHVEFEAKTIWHLIEIKLKKSLPKSEWKKYLSILEQKYGSTKYAIDLGAI
jgi:hypothetical protein